MKRKNFLKIILYYLVFVLGLGLIFGGYVWYMNRQNLVRLNLARPNFPYTKYTVEELEKMYPQYPNENVTTTQTPEETYAKFIAALKRGDVEEASNFFTQRNYMKYIKILDDSKQNKTLSDIVISLDHPLIQKENYGAYAIYTFDGVKKETRIEFIKGVDGVWKIDSL